MRSDNETCKDISSSNMGLFLRHSGQPQIGEGIIPKQVSNSFSGTLSVRTELKNLMLTVSFKDCIGRGRHSTVYQGTLESSELLVAVKFPHCDPESMASSERETKSLAILSQTGCPFFVGCIDTADFSKENGFRLNDLDGSRAMVMPFYVEGTLANCVIGREVSSMDQVFRWTDQLFKGLLAMQEAHLVHHDLKPHNILLQKASDGLYDLLIGDLGMCRPMESDNGIWSLPINTGRGLGTLSYTAPELLRVTDQSDRYSSAVDVYSAGVTVYVMLTGREPFSEGPLNPAELVLAATVQGFLRCGHNLFDEQPDLDPRRSILEELVRQCTQIDPHRRPSPRKVLETLKRFQ